MEGWVWAETNIIRHWHFIGTYEIAMRLSGREKITEDFGIQYVCWIVFCCALYELVVQKKKVFGIKQQKKSKSQRDGINFPIASKAERNSRNHLHRYSVFL